MKYDKDNPPERGDFMTMDCQAGNAAILTRAYRARDKALMREHPEWAETLTVAGPSPTLARLRQLAEEREQLAARMAAVKQRIEGLKKS